MRCLNGGSLGHRNIYRESCQHGANITGLKNRATAVTTTLPIILSPLRAVIAAPVTSGANYMDHLVVYSTNATELPCILQMQDE